VHAELQITRKTDCKLLVANDDNYALAAYKPSLVPSARSVSVRAGARESPNTESRLSTPGVDPLKIIQDRCWFSLPTG